MLSHSVVRTRKFSRCPRRRGRMVVPLLNTSDCFWMRSVKSTLLGPRAPEHKDGNQLAVRCTTTLRPTRGWVYTTSSTRASGGRCSQRRSTCTGRSLLTPSTWPRPHSTETPWNGTSESSKPEILRGGRRSASWGWPGIFQDGRRRFSFVSRPSPQSKRANGRLLCLLTWPFPPRHT